MNEIDSDTPDEPQSAEDGHTSNEYPNNRSIDVIRLIDAYKELSPADAIALLLFNRYYGFFVEIPHPAIVYKEYFRNVPTESPQLRIPAEHSIVSASYVQLGPENVHELAAGKLTNAFEFKGCLNAKQLDSRNDPQQYFFQEHEKTLLRPRARQRLDRVPLFTSATGSMSFARSEDPVSGKRSFLIANISAADLFIDATFASLATPPMAVADEEQLLAEPTDSENQSQEPPPMAVADEEQLFAELTDSENQSQDPRPDGDDWPFDAEIKAPHNFKELCPVVFEAMQIAQFRANDPMDDERVAYLLRKRHPKKYKSPLGDKKRLTLLAEITRPDYRPKPQLAWKKHAFASADADAFIDQDCYSATLRLLMTVARRWVKSGATDESFKQAMKDRHFEVGLQGELAGQFSWIITGRYIPIDIQGRAD